MTEKEQLILATIRQNPLISQKALGEQLGMSREAAANHIMNLTRKGFIRGKGYLLNDPLEVMVVGGCNLDIQGIPAKQGQPGDSLPGQVAMTPGGVGRNIAENIARLGHDVRLVSAVGEDDAGQQLLTATAEAGVDISAIKAFPGHRSPVYLSILDSEHELDFQRVVQKVALTANKTFTGQVHYMVGRRFAAHAQLLSQGFLGNQWILANGGQDQLLFFRHSFKRSLAAGEGVVWLGQAWVKGCLNTMGKHKFVIPFICLILEHAENNQAR